MHSWPMMFFVFSFLLLPSAYAKKSKKIKHQRQVTSKNLTSANPQCNIIVKQIKQLEIDISSLDAKISQIHSSCFEQELSKVNDKTVATQNCQNNEDLKKQIRESGIEIQQKEDQMHALQGDLKIYKCLHSAKSVSLTGAIAI